MQPLCAGRARSPHRSVINNVRRYKPMYLASMVILHTQIHTHAVSPPSCCFQIEIKYRCSQSLFSLPTKDLPSPPRGFCPPQNSGHVLLSSVKPGFSPKAGGCRGSSPSRTPGRPRGRGAQAGLCWGCSSPRSGGAARRAAAEKGKTSRWVFQRLLG